MSFSKISYLIYFLSWLFILLFSSSFDWDAMHTIAEVDLRAFWDEGGLQKWSYQYCGGFTRYSNIGTQNQSPWFILTLLFGSYLGPKLMTCVGMTIALYYFSKFLNEYLGIDLNRSIQYGMIFSLNGYWILHLYHGHTTFVSQFIFISAYLMLHQYLFRGNKRNLIEGILLFFLAFSMNVYQIATYMSIPLVISYLCLLFILLVYKRLSEIPWKRLLEIVGYSLIVPSIYLHKILSAWKYNSSNPRQLTTTDSYGISDLFYSMFLPTADAYKTIFNYRLTPPWGVHEFAYFSLSFWWLIFFTLIVIYKRRSLRIKWSVENTLLFFVILFSVLLYLGEFTEFAPYKLINDVFFGGTQRVSQRYLLFGALALSLITFYILEKKDVLQKFKNPFVISVFILSFLQMFLVLKDKSNLKYSIFMMENNFSASIPFRDKMKYVAFTQQKYPWPSYQLVQQNVAVLNCYTPMRRKTVYNKSFLDNKPEINRAYFFISNSDGSEIPRDSECFKDSYYTQSEITISDSCPNELELRLTDVNPEKPIKNYRLKKSDLGLQLFKN